MVKLVTPVGAPVSHAALREEGVTLLAGDEEVREYWMNEQ